MNPSQPTLADRLAGAVLGAAIGDAMGHPTEFCSMEEIRRRWGPAGVQGYELHWEREGRRFAPYTDDTQLALCVWEGLLASGEGELDPLMQAIAGHFVAWREAPEGGHRAPGNACLLGCRRLAEGVPWSEAGGERAGGCGSVMRAYPFGLFYADDAEEAEVRAVAHSRLTHQDPIALAACAAMALGTRAALLGNPPETIAQVMVSAAERHDPLTAEMMADAAREAEAGVGPEVTLDRLRGWAAHEAIAAGLYLFLRHPDDPRAAILEGANTPGDSDSLATLAGALCGARCGASALPAGWIEEIESRERLEGIAAQLGARAR